ncbi:MAG: hypothetical protein AB1352_04440 [Patescibacteria group bacterium]
MGDSVDNNVNQGLPVSDEQTSDSSPVDTQTLQGGEAPRGEEAGKHQAGSESGGETHAVPASVPAPPAAVGGDTISEDASHEAALQDVAEAPAQVHEGETDSTVLPDHVQDISPPPSLDSPQPSGSPQVNEKIIPAEITEAEKERIFIDKLRVLAPAAVAAKQRKHEERLEAIVAYLRKKGYVSNNEVERICHVANSTATKYLNELKQRGTIIQLGQKGRGVRYRIREAIP